MDSLINLMSMIGLQKTLIIACGGSNLTKYLEFNDRVFIYFLPMARLLHQDYLEKSRIQHFVESKECRQIVFVGTANQFLVDRLLGDPSHQTLRSGLQFNVSPWLKEGEGNILPAYLKNQLLVELHVITQCKYLMEYYFIRERVERNELELRGIVAMMEEEYVKPVYQNGVIFNDIISMN